MTETDSLLRVVLVVVLALLFLPLLFMLVMMPMMGVFGWTHMGGGLLDGPSSWFAWVVMTVVPLLVLAGVGYVVYRLLAQGEGGQTDAAMEELRRAYARGELTDEEFETRRERLRREE